MGNRRFRTFFCAVGWTLAGSVLAGAPDEVLFDNSFEACSISTEVAEDWPKYRRDLANSGRSAEGGINSCNVARLETKWRVQPECDISCGISASPAIATVGGMRTLYVGNANGQMFARNAEDGSERWTFTIPPEHRGMTNCVVGDRCRIASSPAVADGIVYFGAENARLYAVDGTTGVEVWSAPLGDPDAGFEIWSSPAVHDGVVYVGVASHNSSPCVAGRMAARNVVDGSEAWTFEAIDQSTCESGQGDCLGAGIWSSPAIDPAFNTLYVGTGNAGEGCIPATPHADLYPNGILALDLGSGGVKDFFQTLSMDPSDSGDVGASPALHDTQVIDECTVTDVTEQWVSVPSKNNTFWTARRDATGFDGDFVGLETLFDPDPMVDAGEQLIASPAYMPTTRIAECAPGQETAILSSDIFVPRRDGFLFALRQDGAGVVTQRFSREMTTCRPDSCVMVSAPVSIEDVVIFGGGEGNIYALTANGHEAWSSGANGLIASGPAISHGTVYYAAYDGFIYAKSVDGQ